MRHSCAFGSGTLSVKAQKSLSGANRCCLLAHLHGRLGIPEGICVSDLPGTSADTKYYSIHAQRQVRRSSELCPSTSYSQPTLKAYAPPRCVQVLLHAI